MECFHKVHKMANCPHAGPCEGDNAICATIDGHKWAIVRCRCYAIYGGVLPTFKEIIESVAGRRLTELNYGVLPGWAKGKSGWRKLREIKHVYYAREKMYFMRDILGAIRKNRPRCPECSRKIGFDYLEGYGRKTVELNGVRFEVRDEIQKLYVHKGCKSQWESKIRLRDQESFRSLDRIQIERKRTARTGRLLTQMRKALKSDSLDRKALSSLQEEFAALQTSPDS